MSLFQVKDLAVHFGGIKAVDGVSFEVEKGSIFTIIGPNGAGKTTIFNLVSRINDPTAGSIHFEGRDITRVAANRVASLGIARTFQNIELFDNANVLQNILVGCHVHVGTSLLSEILRLPSFKRHEIESRKNVEKIIDFLGLDAYRDSTVGSLPYGVRKMVELGRALAVSPKLLLLDEPSSGLNVEETDNIGSWIRDIRDVLGITILMVTHEPEMAAFAKTIVHFKDGLVERIERGHLANSPIERGVPA